jgi:hypothetical protein
MDRLDDAIEACRTTALDMHSHCESLSLHSFAGDVAHWQIKRRV